MSNVKIEPLNKAHDRENFDCEVKALNQYLQTMALQHQKKDIAKTHVLTFKESGNLIVAFTTLKACDVDLSADKDNPVFKKLPNIAPCLRLCRIAVDKKYKGIGAGKHLMGFTLAKAVQISEDIGCTGIVVDAKDKTAQAYYEQYGFIAFTSDPLRLFLPMKTIKTLASTQAG
ncbi:MAG: GNAT family N-acetyltransferase [Pontibacterium sp.]